MSLAFDPALTTVTLPALQVSLSGVELQSLPALTSASLPALRMMGVLSVHDNQALVSLSLPALESADLLSVVSNPALPECQALALKDRLVAAGGLAAGSWSIEGNDAAATCGP